MCLTFRKNNKQTKKPVNRFLQDDASAGIRSLQASIEIKLCPKPMERTIEERCTINRLKNFNFFVVHSPELLISFQHYFHFIQHYFHYYLPKASPCFDYNFRKVDASM